jgi:DNA-binding XRE family transcriptional regulator
MNGDAMNKVQFILAPSGEKLAVLSEQDYESLLDARDAAEVRATALAMASGERETLSSEEVDAFLDAPTPLAFWRAKRGMTQTALAKLAGISQSYVAGLESGSRKGDPALFLRLAKGLNVPMEVLVVQDGAT